MREGSSLQRPLMLAGRAVRLQEGSVRKKRTIKSLRATLSSPSLQALNPPLDAKSALKDSDFPLNHREMWTNTTLESFLSLPSSLFPYSLLSPIQSKHVGSCTTRKQLQPLALSVKTVQFMRPFSTFGKDRRMQRPGVISARGKLKRLLSSSVHDSQPLQALPPFQVSPSLLTQVTKKHN